MYNISKYLINFKLLKLMIFLWDVSTVLLAGFVINVGMVQTHSAI